jgi:hypothetical protein
MFDGLIPLDSTHPFDWQGGEDWMRSLLASCVKSFGWYSSELSFRPEIIKDVHQFARQVPSELDVFLSLGLLAEDRRHGFEPVPHADILKLRMEMRQLPGLARFLGEAFLPILYLGEGLTIYAYLPKQVEKCADSFAVAVDFEASAFSFVANGIGMLFTILGNTVWKIADGRLNPFGRDVSPVLRDWLR